MNLMYLNFLLSEKDCSIFCSTGQKVLFKHEVKDDKVVNFPLVLQKILNTVEEKQKTIKAVTCSVGPVSFSGDRLVLAFASGFAKAIKKELYGISLFEILEVNALDNGIEDFFILLDSKKDSFVLWKNGAKFIVEKAQLPEAIKNLAVKNLVVLGAELNLTRGLLEKTFYVEDITDEMYVRAIDVKFFNKSLQLAKEPQYITAPNIAPNIKMATNL